MALEPLPAAQPVDVVMSLEEVAHSAGRDEEAAQLDAIIASERTRSWGRWLIVMGVIQLVASQFLDPGWGVLLMLVGVASFYFRSLAMLAVYGVIMAWAAISNAFGGIGSDDPRRPPGLFHLYHLPPASCGCGRCSGASPVRRTSRRRLRRGGA